MARYKLDRGCRDGDGRLRAHRAWAKVVPAALCPKLILGQIACFAVCPEDGKTVYATGPVARKDGGH